MEGSVLCFGEVLLRICPDSQADWIGNQSMPVFIGGAELNVSRALARWDVPVAFLSRLPDNFLANQVMHQLQLERVDTSRILRGGRRTGLYFLPTGETIQNQGVIYDREGSSFWELKRGMVDWTRVFEGVSWFHVSAINPALNDEIAWLCEEGMKVAHDKGITVSIDLNYRPKLWKTGRDPRWVMESLLPYCHVVMGNVWAADSMLGIQVDKALQTHDKEACVQHAQITSQRIMQLFPDVKQVYNTFRFETSELSYFATLNTPGKSYVSVTYRSSGILDKVGSGDCFMAGIISGTTGNRGAQETLDFSTAAAFQKLFTKGDSNVRSAEEIVLFSAPYAN
jgi:2-dehydro-3-deoxygluconokinase